MMRRLFQMTKHLYTCDIPQLALVTESVLIDYNDTHQERVVH